MKTNLVITMLFLGILGSGSAFAHPTDEDPITMIPRGSTLTLLRDLNIKPNESYIRFYFSESESSFDGGFSFCHLNVNTSPDDRLLLATDLENDINSYPITAVTAMTDQRADLILQSVHLVEIHCRGVNQLRIGLFRELVKDTFRLDLAPPIVVTGD